MFRIALSGLVFASSAIAAETPPTVGFIDAGKPFCAARSYDDAHMKAHPKQEITGLAVAYVPFVKDGGQQVPMWSADAEGKTRINYSIVATIRDSKEVLGNSGTCYQGKSAETLTCEMDGDGGIFTLTKQADGKFLLDNPAYFVVISNKAAEEDHEFIHINAEDDHAAFALELATGGLCEGG